MDELLRWRREFPILETCTYLISNSLGAMPRRVFDHLREYAETWANRGICAWDEGWWEMPVASGDVLGRIVGAGPGEISLHQNVTIAEAIVFSALRPTPRRNKVVYSELNFPSVRYFYQAQPEIKVEVVPCEDRMSVPLERFLESIDERTLLVPMSHVIFKSAFVQDARTIIERAHAKGAMVLLDTYHSCGSIPFDVKELDVDFVVGGSVKWLCGGPGVAYLYVKPELRDSLEPRLTGWMAHPRPFDFEPDLEFSNSAFRFLNGTPNIPGIYAARAGYEIIAEVGVEAIRKTSLKLTQRIIDRADEYGFEIRTPRAVPQRGGTVTVCPPGAQLVSRKLIERGVVIDYRPGAGIRVAPHFYNTLDEIDQAMAEMKTIAEEVTS